jgi:hypothetical protein
MFGIVGKIKTYIIAALALALPVIYLIGNIKGRYKEKNKVIKDELQAQQKASTFYKNMAEHDTENLTDSRSLADRLRSNGL